MSRKIIGPFSQILTMDGLPLKGPIDDGALEIMQNSGILIEGSKIKAIAKFEDLIKIHDGVLVFELDGEFVGLPGFIDPHTHICFSGSRANDYAMRIAGKSYLEIAREGGGIWQTVEKTREASQQSLTDGIVERSQKMLQTGITTAEVKSGYGLDPENELKMLQAISRANSITNVELIPTCLAAHIKPRDFEGSSKEYLKFIIEKLLPEIKKNDLSNRIDIFIEEGAFNSEEATVYLKKAKDFGFDLTVHGDQFTTSGSSVAIETGALSVDHLEAASEKVIHALANSTTIATVLPGASIGLGMQFAPARELLNAGCCVAIGSDWNPGSAPMGDLLIQSAILSASEKLSNAEVFAGITYRSASALGMKAHGILAPAYEADVIGFPTDDYREILYNQGMLKPNFILKKGNKIE